MSEDRKQVLVVDDEANMRRVLSEMVRREGCDVLTAEDGEAALAALRDHHVDLVITDLRMPKLDGMGLLRQVLAAYPGLPVLMITAHGTVDNAVEALKMGAFDYLTKPFDKHEIQAVVRKALRTRELGEADVTPFEPRRDERASRHGIIGGSEPILAVYALLDRVADTPSTVLITGESGTGKELVARALHEGSSRRDRPFIKVNCAAIPKDLMESELFGYERGAFTGAVTSKPGRFELASGGTLFLDEIGEIPVEMQVKLLRVLQEGEFERVGGIKTLRVDVRLVAATNRDLKREIAHGHFREDVYYRLNVVPIVLPPLRERTTDIPLLAQAFLRKLAERLKKSVSGIEPAAMARLLGYAWPGNVRELENVLERAVLFADGAEIREDDLPVEIHAHHARAHLDVTTDGPAHPVGGLKEQVKAATSRLERDIIVRALEQTAGNVTHAARLLQISRKGLQLKMKELGLRERTERDE